RRHILAGFTTIFLHLSARDSTPTACSYLVAHLVGSYSSKRCFFLLVLLSVQNFLTESFIHLLKAEGALADSWELRPVKYLNHLVEQDHRFLKRLVKPGLGFFSPETA